MCMSSPRRGSGGEAGFRIFGKQLAQHDHQVRRLPHRCEGKRDANVGDDDLAHLSRAQRPQILKVERKQDAVPGGCRRAQEHFIRSEACKGCALLGRNHHQRLLQSICRQPAFLPRHGRALNCEIYVVRRKKLALGRPRRFAKPIRAGCIRVLGWRSRSGARAAGGRVRTP